MPDDTAAQTPALDFPASLPYRVLDTKHDDYDGKYLRLLKAFYKGGKALLRDPEVMAEVFPRYRDESQAIYDKRCQRALYLPYANEIINFIVASMSAERLEIGQRSKDEEAKPDPLPEWWKRFADDVSPPGGKTCSLHDLVKAAILDALLCRVSWHRVDLPESVEAEFASEAEQEKAGALNAYVVPIPAECVIDWEEDESGSLTMVITHAHEAKRTTFAASRDMLTEIWRVYTRTGWARYEKARKRCDKFKEDEQIPRVGAGSHSFGSVPILRLDVGDGLWAMDNIESSVRSHFNANSARLWALFQSLFQELYEFTEPKDGELPGLDDGAEKKVTSQRRGQGFVQTRAKDAKAEFIGPDTSSFTEARNTCNDLRTEIHRVTHQMALAVDNTGAALGRSAESKGHDKASAVVVFEALGQLARKFAEELCAMVARGRGDKDLQFAVSGMAKFDAISIDDEISRDLDLESVSVPSATFQRWRKLNLAKTRMGDEGTPELLEAIKNELEEAITQESFEVADEEREQVDLGRKSKGQDGDEGKPGSGDDGDETA